MKKFIEAIEQTYRDGVEIIKLKNQDYATKEDPWKNFRQAELVGVSLERAILVRVSDKLSRISNLIDKEPAVVDEKLEDTLLDCINYLAILKAHRDKDSK